MSGPFMSACNQPCGVLCSHDVTVYSHTCNLNGVHMKEETLIYRSSTLYACNHRRTSQKIRMFFLPLHFQKHTIIPISVSSGDAGRHALTLAV